MVPTGVPPSFEGATEMVAGDVDCGVINLDDAGTVEDAVAMEDAVDKLAPLTVLRAAIAEDVVFVEASLILK